MPQRTHPRQRRARHRVPAPTAQQIVTAAHARAAAPNPNPGRVGGKPHASSTQRVGGRYHRAIGDVILHVRLLISCARQNNIRTDHRNG